MTNSKGSVVVRGQGPQHGLAGVVVVPDGGGHRQESLQDADDDTGGSAAAVSFEAELALEGVED